MRSRTSRLMVLVLTGALALSGCSGGPDAGGAAGEQGGKGRPPAPETPTVWPLTGVEAAKVVERPALAIKIENSPESRPQTGLEDADMVWEEVVEGGITRFVAVYHSAIPDKVEPVRSVRPMDPAIVAPLHGILAYSGAQRPFIEAVEASGTQSIIMDRGDAGFERDPGRNAPHNVIGFPEEFLAQADDDRTVPPPAQLTFARAVGKGTADVSGTPASALAVELSPAQTSTWDWHAKSGTWRRSEGSEPAVSTAGERLSARNVVVLSVDVVNTRFKDASGSPVPETKLVGKGEGLVASGGKTVAVTWSKKDEGERLVLMQGDEEVQLDPGSTWVELVPRKTGSWSVG